MFLLICRTNNHKPNERNIIDSHGTLSEAKTALRRECKSKRDFLVYEGDTIAMFNSADESWTIEIWHEKDYDVR